MLVKLKEKVIAERTFGLLYESFIFDCVYSLNDCVHSVHNVSNDWPHVFVYRAALRNDVGTQVVADDPYFGGKVWISRFLSSNLRTISQVFSPDYFVQHLIIELKIIKLQ